MPEAAGARVLALDFDGVICDSEQEVLTVAALAFEALEPGSEIVRTLQSCGPDHALRRRMVELIPLGNRAEDFGVALRSLEDELELGDQETYDAFYAQQPEQWLQDYHRSFYRERAALRKADPQGWLELHRAYHRFTDVLRARPEHIILAIATSKDRESVSRLLHHFRLSDLVPNHLLLDKETGPDKSAHLQALSALLEVGFDAITFIDDKVNHLMAVAPLGVRAVLAGWGFNGAREQALAKDLGFEVVQLHDAGARLLASLS